MKSPIFAPVTASLDSRRGASLAFQWREPPKAFEFDGGPDDNRRYAGIHLEAGVRCAKVSGHPPPVAVVDLPGRKKMLVTEISCLEGNDWGCVAETLLAASKDAPTITCKGITFPAIDWEGPGLEVYDEPFVFKAVQEGRFPDGYRRAEAVAEIFLEQTTDPTRPIDFRGLLLVAFFVTHKDEDIMMTCHVFDWTRWVRA